MKRPSEKVHGPRRSVSRLLAWLTLPLIVSFLGGCLGGGANAGARIVQSKVLTLSSGLSPSPTNVNFGDVLLSASGIQNVALTNTGNEILTIIGAVASDPAFNIDGVLQRRLAPGESINATITFTPSSLGSITGNILLQTDFSEIGTVLNVSGGSHQVNLTWDGSNVAGITYSVLRSNADCQTFLPINFSVVIERQFADPNVQSGVTYCYEVNGFASTSLLGTAGPVQVTIPSP